MTAAFQHWGMAYEWAWFLATFIGILLIAFPLMLAVAMIIYAERKIWAAIALRRGPNIVGPWGLLQSFADGLKVFLKETIIPTSANKGLFLIAPIVTFTVALIVWAVVPFDAGVVLADVNVGLLYILAASSLGVYGVIVAGWASNSKYPFFSALRAAAQMVSYEVSIGFVLITVVLYANTFNLSEIVLAQKGNILGFFNGYGFNPLLFPMWVVFFISSMAETFRTPFDLVEAESELVAGHQTEYSSMSFALFWLGEYANTILMCALNAIIFWGGWLPPVDWAPLYYVPGILWLFAKMGFFFFCFGWVKATVPRYRYDQLMRLGWKIFLPLSLVFVVLVSGWLMLTRYGPKETMEVAAYGAPAGHLVEIQYDCSVVRTADAGPYHFVLTRKYRAGGNAPTIWSATESGRDIPVDEFKVERASIGGTTGLTLNAGSSVATAAVINWSDIVGGAAGIRLAEKGSGKVVGFGSCKETGLTSSTGNAA